MNLRTLMNGAMAKYGDRDAIVADGKTWSFRDLDAAANRLAHALRDLGVAAGTPVALMLPNSAEYVIADQALLRLGAAKIPLNDMLSPQEAAYIVRDSKAVVAIADSSWLPVVKEQLDAREHLRTSIVVGVDDAPSQGVIAWESAFVGKPSELPAATIRSSDVGLMLYTGGTTGRPKGVVHQQEQLALNLLAHQIETELHEDDRLLLSSPLPHSAGFLLQTALLSGAVTHVQRGFDAHRVLETIHEDRISYLFMVPTMIYRLLDQAARGNWNLSSVRTMLYGAAPISTERLEEGISLLGPVFTQLYGQSEAPNFITRLRKEDHLPGSQRLRSCGQPCTMSEVRIVDQDGNACPPGVEGEVTARTAYTMKGYNGLPEATDRTLKDGWLHTGDIGYLDEHNYLYLLDRKNDMIITGGMNVYSSEVEEALREHPNVRQAAVVGIPHADWGEAVVAFVVTDNDEFDENDLKDHCRESLSAYKRPKTITPIDTLPLTTYGKVDKKSLRAIRARSESA